ncbi:MAG: class II aldolase and adducin N-terminal domain-containing protein [Rhodobacteraceae bacterium]|nr:class II aldolase and adducin N-terminal domain-containing protein [Paracoccaceae bacterium]MCY4138001.1 class II aldolase and adducin N-terminal domain-containing protein [Paracoccaceae bacterium]
MRQVAQIENLTHWTERTDLAAASRWTARLNMHEAVANHFSLTVSDDGKWFLMNPNQRHFSRIKASDLLLLDSDNPATMNQPGAPDPTAWGLHGSIHRQVPHARCVMHVHSIHATVLACLKDSTLLPIDQNTATFYGRTVVDECFGGLAFEEEGARCAKMLFDPKVKVMIMGNHGVLVIGSGVADTFNRLYYFERAAETYVRALQTGKPLRVLSHEIAEKAARELDNYPDQAERHLTELKAILDDEGSDYAS